MQKVRSRSRNRTTANDVIAGRARYALIQGDSAEVLAGFPDASVDMVMTSPPYWAVREYDGGSGLGNESTPEEYVEHLVSILAHLERVLKPTGSLWLNLGDTYLRKNLLGIPWRVAFALQARGWILRNAVVWDKSKGPCNAKDKLRNTYEMVFHLVLNPSYYYDLDSIREEPGKAQVRPDGTVITATGVSGKKYERQILESPELTEEERASALKALRRTLERVARGELYDFRMIIRGYQRTTHSNSLTVSGRANDLQRHGFYILPYHPKGPKPGDVWRITPEDEWRRDSHAAVYPTALCTRPILATSPVGGIVLDPFVGTGTTVVEALRLGRRAIGIDTSAEYLAVADDRVRRTAQQLSLLGS